MKKILILAIVILISITSFFIYQNFFKPIQVKEIRDNIFEVYLKSNKKKYTEEKDWYSLNLEYPENTKIVADFIFGQMNNFLGENELKKYNNLEEAKAALNLIENMKYSFSATYRQATTSETISYVYTVNSFTGGAHGSTQLLPITLDNKGNILKPSEILPDKYLSEVAKLAIEQISAEKLLRLKQYGMNAKEIKKYLEDDTLLKEGAAPIRDNYNAVWLDGENLKISFGQYQVGPYAEGIYEVTIPKKNLSN